MDQPERQSPSAVTNVPRKHPHWTRVSQDSLSHALLPQRRPQQILPRRHSDSRFDANDDSVIAQELQIHAVGQLTSSQASTDQLRTLFESLGDLTDA